MGRDLFRHDTVERLSSPAQLSKLLVVIRLRGWIALATLVALIVGILTWSVLGEIPIITTGKGILLAPNSQFSVSSPAQARVNAVYVKAQQEVKMGTPLMSLSTGTVIEAPKNGKVFQLEAGAGDQVEVGEALLWFETQIYPADLVVYAFIPIQAGERIKKGMHATVDLGAVDTQKYGQLVGTVKEVVPYAVSKTSDRLKVIPSDKLKDDLTAGATAILVIIQPKLDPANQSGIAWTFGKGPPNQLSPGSLGAVRITVESKKPISYLIPVM